MAEGIAGLPFVRDIITLLDNWQPSNGGKKPNITAQWEKKIVGHGNSNYDEIIISLDSENVNIYSMISKIENGQFSYDWLHDISITLDIRSGKSEERILQLVDETMRILKNAVVSTLNNREYIQILPGNVVSLNEDYRNLFRYTVDVDGMRFNP